MLHYVQLRFFNLIIFTFPALMREKWQSHLIILILLK